MIDGPVPSVGLTRASGMGDDENRLPDAVRRIGGRCATGGSSDAVIVGTFSVVAGSSGATSLRSRSALSDRLSLDRGRLGDGDTVPARGVSPPSSVSSPSASLVYGSSVLDESSLASEW